MKLFTSLTLAASALVSLPRPTQAAPIFLNQNAIVNPGAELGLGSATGNDIFLVPGWLTSGNFTAVQYGAPAAPVLSPGPDFGYNFFSGGPNNPTNAATQLIDVSSLSASIDINLISYVLSGYFGGYLYQNDNSTLTATFLSSTSTILSTPIVVGGFNSTARSNISQLLFDSRTGVFPVGTRSVLLTLTMNRTEGFYNDGYADNLSFVVSRMPFGETNPTPESSTFALAGFGLLLVARLRRR